MRGNVRRRYPDFYAPHRCRAASAIKETAVVRQERRAFLIKRECGMKKEHYFQSSDEKTSLHAIVWEPEGSVKAVH